MSFWGWVGGGGVQFEIKSACAPPKNKAWWRLKGQGA